MNKVKILYVSHSPFINGAEMCLLTLLKHLDRTAFDPVVVFPSDGPLVNEIKDLQIKTFIVSLERWIRYSFDNTLKESCLNDRVEAIASIIRSENIQLVHTNTSVVIEGAIAASLVGVPHIWHVHETLVGHPELIPMYPLPLIFNAMSFLSDYIVSVAASAQRQFEGIISSDKLITIHNGISPRIFPKDLEVDKRKDLHLSENLIIITVGELTERKGYPAWLQVASAVTRKNQNVQFLWVGHASESSISDFNRIVTELHLENTVKHLGFRRDAQDLIKSADIYLSTSINEAFPMVILEAMAAGKAVISTDCGGSKEGIIDGVTGFIADVNDVENLSEAILRLASDKDMLTKLGEAAADHFLNNFTAEIYAQKFCKLYKEVLAADHSARKNTTFHHLISQLVVMHQSHSNNLMQLKESFERIERLQVEVAHHSNITVQLSNQINAMKATITQKTHEVAFLQKKLQEKENTIVNQSLAITNLHNSASWKITAPLRKIYDFLNIGPTLNGTSTCSKYSTDTQPLGPVLNGLETYPTTIPPKEILEFPISVSPTVSIIIPVYDQFEYTFSCLTSILKNTSESEYEIIIADDCSNDETKDILNYVCNITHIRNNTNLGFLLNCNNAAVKARGKYILFLNNDTNVQKDWLIALTEILDKNPGIGMTGSKLVYPDGRLQEAGGIIWNDANGQNYGRLDDRTKPEYNYLKEVDYISGASIMVRKELWDRLHGFDERFAPAYYEDTDLAFSIRKLGYKVVYQPKSVVVHFEGISHGTDLGSGIKSYQVRNKNFFLEKWREVLESKHFPMDTDLFLARDRSRNKKTILFIDYQVPLFDQFAGSRTNYMYLRMLLHMGFNVKFIGADFYHIEPYSTALNDLGIETLDGDWYRENWKQWILQNAQYLDYVLLNKPDPANMFLDFIKENTDAKIIYQVHDLHYLRLERKYEVEGDKKVLSEAKKYKDIESDIFSKADMVFTFSTEENSIISKSFPEVNVKTVPLYFYEDFPPVSYEFENRSSVLFVGGFAHAPNIDAVSWFCKEILPLVHPAVPNLTFKVIGSNPPPEIRCLASNRIQILGFVTDEQLKQHYQASRLVVIPLRFGAGVKGKTLEAMYYGLPIVSTSIGIEGIPDISNVISPTDDAEAFAKRIIDLYQFPKILEDASRNNRDFIRSRYNFMSAQKCIEGIFTELGMNE